MVPAHPARPDRILARRGGRRPAVDRFLDAELARYRLGANRLVLVGFSQGTMLALHIGLRRPTAPAAVVGFSGLLAGPEHLAEAEARPPILLIHGAQDDLIPVEALHIAREPLAKAGHLVEWHISERVGHGIDAAGQHLAGHFISSALRGRARSLSHNSRLFVPHLGLGFTSLIRGAGIASLDEADRDSPQ